MRKLKLLLHCIILILVAEKIAYFEECRTVNYGAVARQNIPIGSWKLLLNITIKHRNAARFATPLDVRKQKKLSADQGLCPWTPLGALPPDTPYRLALPRSPCIWAVPLFLSFRRLCVCRMHGALYSHHHHHHHHQFIKKHKQYNKQVLKYDIMRTMCSNGQKGRDGTNNRLSVISILWRYELWIVIIRQDTRAATARCDATYVRGRKSDDHVSQLFITNQRKRRRIPSPQL